jgi:hypothetical protein
MSYGRIKDVQAIDGYQRSTDILRKFLADGFKHLLEVIKILELILCILSSQATISLSFASTSSDRGWCIPSIASASGLVPDGRLDDDGA